MSALAAPRIAPVRTPISRTLARSALVLAGVLLPFAFHASIAADAPGRSTLAAQSATQVSITFPSPGTTIAQASMSQVPVNFRIDAGGGTVASIQVVICQILSGGVCVSNYLPVANLPVPASGPYQALWTPPQAGASFSNGTVNFLAEVYVTMSTGELAQSATVPFTYQYNPVSTIALRFPYGDVELFDPASAVLWGVASFAPDAGTTVHHVEFFDGMTSLGTVATANVTPAGYALLWPGAPQGVHEIWMRVVDTQGRGTDTAASTLFVLPPRPAIDVILTSPTTGETYGYQATIPLHSAVTLSSGRIERVEYLDGVNVIATSTAAPYQATWSLPSDGMHAISARAFDALGNASASKAAYIRTAGNPRPFLGLLKSPVDQSVYALGAPVTVELEFENPDSPLRSIDYTIDGESLPRIDHAPFTYTFTPSWTGKHSVQASAYDVLGRWVNTPSIHYFVTPDGKPPVGDQPTGPPPTIALTAPADHASFSAGGNIALAASASGHGTPIVSVAFYANSSQVGSVAGLPYQLTWKPSQAGSYSITAVVTVSGGRSAVSSPVNVSVTNPSSSVSLAPVASGTNFYQGDSVLLKPAEMHVTGPATRVEYFVDGVSVGSAGPPYLFDWDAPGPGTYSLSLRVFDDLGPSAISAAVPFTVKPIRVTITSPVDGSTADAPTLFVEGTYEGSQNVGIRVNGILATRDVKGHFFVNALLVGDSPFTITAEATSMGGSRVSSTVSVTKGANVDDDTPQLLDMGSEGVDAFAMPLMVANPESVASWRLLDSHGAAIGQGGTTQDGTLTTVNLPAPGLYHHSLEITDRKGRVFLRSCNALVTSASDLQGEHIAVINRFFDSLAKQKKDRALSTLTSGMALVFAQVYDALSDHWPDIVKSIAAVGATHHSLEGFEAAAIRDRDGQRFVYLIEGIKDDDGVWRIDSF